MPLIIIINNLVSDFLVALKGLEYSLQKSFKQITQLIGNYLGIWKVNTKPKENENKFNRETMQMHDTKEEFSFEIDSSFNAKLQAFPYADDEFFLNGNKSVVTKL